METKQTSEEGRPMPRTEGPAFDSPATFAETAPQDLRLALDDVLSSVEELYRVVGDLFEQRLRDRPYATLGGAIGIGFALGGGLAARTAGLLVNLGGALFAMRILAGVRERLERRRALSTGRE